MNRSLRILDSFRNLFFFRSMKDAVDPHRFLGKTFKWGPAFPDTPNDMVMKIDGLSAGRIMKMKGGFQRIYWLWTLTGPSYPLNQPHNGEEDTFEAAVEALKSRFWEWHAWALKQNGPAIWYGAIE